MCAQARRPDSGTGQDHPLGFKLGPGLASLTVKLLQLMKISEEVGGLECGEELWKGGGVQATNTINGLSLAHGHTRKR